MPKSSKSTLTTAFAKVRSGEPLKPDEKEAIKAYHRRRDQGSTHLYWDSPEQKARYQKIAEGQGVRNFSAWLIKQIERGANASTVTMVDMERLREEVQTANRRLDQEAENSAFFREQAKRFERERDDLQTKNVKLEEQLAQLEEKLEQRMKTKEARK